MIFPSIFRHAIARECKSCSMAYIMSQKPLTKTWCLQELHVFKYASSMNAHFLPKTSNSFKFKFVFQCINPIVTILDRNCNHMTLNQRPKQLGVFTCAISGGVLMTSKLIADEFWCVIPSVWYNFKYFFLFLLSSSKSKTSIFSHCATLKLIQLHDIHNRKQWCHLCVRQVKNGKQCQTTRVVHQIMYYYYHLQKTFDYFI